MKKPIATRKHDLRISFAHYLSIVGRKGRSVRALYQTIEGLIGLNSKAIEKIISKELTSKNFFEKVTFSANVDLGHARVCGDHAGLNKNPLKKSEF